MFKFQSFVALLLGIVLLPPSILAEVTTASCDGQTFVVEATSLGALRADFQGFVGMWFTVGSTPLKVTCLGRMFHLGNVGTHTVKLVRALDGTDVPGGSVAVKMTGGSVNQFVYAALPAPVTLNPNTSYYLASEEFSGGDSFRDYHMTILKTSTAAACKDSVYKLLNTGWNNSGYTNRCYGPLNFLYEDGSAPAPAGPFIVTTSASPPAGGTTTGGAAYPGQTTVTVTATENPGFTFVNWTDHGTEVSRSRSFSFSSVTNRDLVANFIPTTAPDCSSKAFVTEIYSLGVVRSDFTGLVGMWLRVGPEPMNVTCLARLFSEGNMGTHTVKLVRAADFTDIPGGAVNINMVGGTVNAFVYQPLPAPVMLDANTDYFLVSDEVLGGDRWRDYRATTVIKTGDATCVGAVYKIQSEWKSFVSPNHSYVPLNFRYQTGLIVTNPPPVDPPGPIFTLTTTESPAGSGLVTGGGTFALSSLATVVATPKPGFAFVNWTENGSGASPLTTYSFNVLGNRNLVANFALTPAVDCGPITFVQASTQLGALRADFTGRVGMWISVGAQPLQVSCLGRQFSSGNSRTHTVKVVRASDRTDVPGGSVDIDMRGGVLNGFVYRSLPAPIQLDANTDYYIVSLEESGGDQWHDQLMTSVTTASGATCKGAVYMNAAWPWTQVPAPNHSYGLVDFRFQLGPVVPPPGTRDFHITTAASPVGGGLTSGSGDYSPGAPVTVSMISHPGFRFVNWTEGGVGVSPAGTFTFNASADRLLVANFVSTSLPDCAGTRFVTGVPSLGALRRDFTGWVGMWVTTGPNPIQVTCLGRQFAPGNTLVHRVKLVRAADNIDVPGGATDVSMLGGTTNEIVYQPLANSVTLAANTGYYLVTEESATLDQWRDYTATLVTKRGEAICNGAVYASASIPWTRIPATDRVYGVVDFQYAPVGGTGGVGGVDPTDGPVKLDLLVLGETISIFASGPPGRTYSIEASDDLQNWSPLGPVTLNNGKAELKNVGTGQGHQFYRAVGP